MNALIQYIRDTRGEMRHVAWPTQQQTTIFTILVIIVSLITAFYLGALDFLFTRVLEFIIG
jgi:preprotein translocase subunit SecE